MASLLKSALLFTLFTSSSLAIQLFNTPGELPTFIPASCRVALTANITCPNYFITASDVLRSNPIDAAQLTSYCTPACSSSLATFQSTVTTRCGATKYAFTPAVNQSGSDIANALVWAYNVTCQQNAAKSGYCYPNLRTLAAGRCDDCFLKYEAAVLGSAYGYRLTNPSAFSSLLTSCNVPATKYPIPTISVPTPVTAPITANPTCTGQPYTVKTGDTCASIGDAAKVAQDRLITANSLDYNCTALLVGDTLCLGDTCTLRKVAKNETCNDILGKLTGGISITELVSWNPTLHTNCDNIDQMVGRSICVSPPGGTWNLPTVNATTTAANISWVVPTGTGLVPVLATASIPTNASTIWFFPTTTIPIPTSTYIVNASLQATIAARQRWCPTFTDGGEGFGDLPQNCQDLWDPYCNPKTLTGPLLPSPTGIPASCAPDYPRTFA